MKRFFVMLNHPSGQIVPLITESDEVALFTTLFEAQQVASQNIVGRVYGYEVFLRKAESK